jgi:hypothetical protein
VSVRTRKLRRSKPRTTRNRVGFHSPHTPIDVGRNRLHCRWRATACLCLHPSGNRFEAGLVVSNVRHERIGKRGRQCGKTSGFEYFIQSTSIQQRKPHILDSGFGIFSPPFRLIGIRGISHASRTHDEDACIPKQTQKRRDSQTRYGRRLSRLVQNQRKGSPLSQFAQQISRTARNPFVVLMRRERVARTHARSHSRAPDSLQQLACANGNRRTNGFDSVALDERVDQTIHERDWMSLSACQRSQTMNLESGVGQITTRLVEQIRATRSRPFHDDHCPSAQRRNSCEGRPDCPSGRAGLPETDRDWPIRISIARRVGIATKWQGIPDFPRFDLRNELVPARMHRPNRRRPAPRFTQYMAKFVHQTRERSQPNRRRPPERHDEFPAHDDSLSVPDEMNKEVEDLGSNPKPDSVTLEQETLFVEFV